MNTAHPDTQDQPRPPRWLALAGVAAGGILFCAFLIGLAGILGYNNPATGNWLVTLFNLNYRPSTTPTSALTVVSLLDITLMLLFGFLMASMYPALSRDKGWAVIAVALPFLGVIVFLATATAGRSAVLLAGLISSILALRAKFASPVSAISGIIASTLLLFVGDFGTAALPPSILLALLIALGYVL